MTRCTVFVLDPVFIKILEREKNLKNHQLQMNLFDSFNGQMLAVFDNKNEMCSPCFENVKEGLVE